MASKRRRRGAANEEDALRPYAQESLLIGAVPEMAGQGVLCTSAGLAQFALAVAEALPDTNVCCTYLDLYRASLAIEHLRERPGNLQIECAADLPVQEVDIVAFPFSAGGEAELIRDFIQTGHQRLTIGGRMFAATENRKDTWLGEQLQKLFRKLERRKLAKGVLYVGTKTQPLKKIKNYGCEFAFRDRGRLIRAFSRPGVFSHRHIDPGARHLIDAMEVRAGARVLDIGCGAGVVALAAAFAADGVRVHAADSNARAVQCTQRGAELNELENLSIELNADGSYLGAGQYDLALANPPYYSGFRIAQHFLEAGHAALKAGGQIFVVTKRADWYEQNMPRWFNQITIVERKGYQVLRGTKR